MFQPKGIKDGEKIGIVDALGAHLTQGVRINDLLTKGATRQVWALGEIEDRSKGGFVNSASIDRP
jgi:hypothetical protein